MTRSKWLALLALSLLLFGSVSCGQAADQPAPVGFQAGSGVSELATVKPAGSSDQDLPPGGSNRDNILKVQAMPVGAEGFSFVYLGDSRNSSPGANDGDKTYARIIQAANKLAPRFVIHGGDFTIDNSGGNWQNVQKLNKQFQMPLVTVIGNHETIFGRSFYEQNFNTPNSGTGLDDYSFEYGGVRFIGLDDANGTVTSQQFTWLQGQLQTNLLKVVMFHEPPYVGNWKVHAMDDQTASNKLLGMLDKSQTDLVLVSHLHLFDDTVRRGHTQYLVSGGAGAPLRNASFGQATNHIVQIQVTPGQGISYKMVPVQ